MANGKAAKRVPRKTASGLPALLARLPEDARKAIAHNRAELEKAVQSVRREVERPCECRHRVRREVGRDRDRAHAALVTHRQVFAATARSSLATRRSRRRT